MTKPALAAAILILATLSLPAENSAALLTHLQEAASATTLDAPGNIPFHLKLTVDIVPQTFRPAQHGTVELWWSAPGEQRTVYDLTLYHATIVESSGTLYRTADTPAPPYIVSYLLNQVLHPIPTPIDPLLKPEVVTRPFGKLKLDCTALRSPTANVSDLYANTFCFDNQSQLRVGIVSGDEYTIRQTTGVFGERHVPLTVEYAFFNHTVATAHIDLLQGHQDAFPESSLIVGLTPVPKPPAIVPGWDLAGKLVKRPPPTYPPQAKERRIAGSVLLHAIIGADGRIKDLSLIGSADDLLTPAAMQAVRQWVYTPYMRDGIPTEVDTVVTVNFRFG